MKTFIQEDFLLATKFAKKLYHDYAKDLPIIDYHNHLSPKDIAENTKFENITEVWLAGDHYKWRGMRTLGIDEKYITGSATDRDKFLKWAQAVPYTVRNPLYHWTHLELLRYFNIDELLSSENAENVYKKTGEMLQQEEYRTVGLLKMQHVEVICTTDDPVDSLQYHSQLKNQSIGIKVLPTFRPDKAYAVEQAGYPEYLEKLGRAANTSIENYDDLEKALEKRIDYFHEHGCRLADHGLEQLYVFNEKVHDVRALFLKLKEGNSLMAEEIHYFKMKVILFLCRKYHEKGWTQQFHLGAIRNNNTRLLGKLGPDTGFDSIGDFSQARGLSSFLDNLDSTNELTQTILYNNNPVDNEVYATMAGNYNDGTQKGKVQFGSAWWFMDQKDGMERQLNTLSNLGVLSTFVGMLTDSRSFLSFPRHEYFRRILCNLIASDVAKGELPADEKWLGKIVSDICYYNAKEYFKF